MTRMAREIRRRGIAGVLGAVTLCAVPLAGAAEGPVRFATQAWPGVTVKTQVATRLLGAMGYETTTTDLSPQFVYQGIRTGDVDVSLGAWMPAHEDMLQPLLNDGVAVEHAANLEGAIQGLAVPANVYDDGIRTVEDLIANGERFGRTIYAIGSGAAMTRAFQDAVADDYKGLGDWSVVPSSVAGMLSQVERAAEKDEAIVFHGWKPHWMDLAYDIRFLSDGEDSRIAGLETTVYTIVAAGWPEKNPQVARFLKQFKVPVAAQNEWIDGFSRKDREPSAVATAWIESNMSLVEQWVDGVETASGDSGVEAVRKAFGA